MVSIPITRGVSIFHYEKHGVNFGGTTTRFFEIQKLMAALRSQTLKVNFLVGPTCKIPRSTQRSERSGIRRSSIRCAKNWLAFGFPNYQAFMEWSCDAIDSPGISGLSKNFLRHGLLDGFLRMDVAMEIEGEQK